MLESTSPYPPNVQYELARERNRIAADRTLLAWIRSSILQIGFGIGLERSLTALASNLGVTSISLTFVKLVGTAFVGLGSYAIIMAAIDYRQEIQRLTQEDYTYVPRKSLGMTTAVVLVVIAVFSFLGILWQASSY
ncbi:MAG: YidH family protein [Synechococcus sp.]